MIRRVLASLLPATLGLAVTLVVLLTSGRAQAYPQWQFSSGTGRCAQCHFSPSGGGIVTNYARDAVGEDLSSFEGDGAFAHGAIDLPKAVALQFDGRYAALYHDVGEASGAHKLFFPMQADLSLRLGLTDAISFVGVAGYRGQARGYDQPLGQGAAQPQGGSLFISREHYLMWRPAAMGTYVRAGRFFAPFGLRLAEHNTYVRRDTGYNTLMESYNLSIGFVQSAWELHLTAFAPDVVRHIGADEYGGAGLFEVRVGDATALGLSGRAGMKTDRNRYTGGVFGKTYVEAAKFMLMTELDLTHSIYEGGRYSDQAFAGYVGLVFFPYRGLWLTPFGERTQTNITVRDSAINAAGLQMNWFPYPHFEIMWQLRGQFPSASDKSAMSAVAFIHYYL
jgi:hypothetical protein